MLTDKDKENLKDLLKLMSEEDIKKLSLTVTQNRIVPITIEEAVDAILIHSPTTESLLLRKKISKDILFRYLHEKKIPSVPTSDKKTFIESILQLWNDNSRQIQELQHNTVHPSNAQSHEVDELARAFTNWFYSMFNQQEMALGAEHFWQDCSMCLTFTCDMSTDTFEAHNNAVEVVKLLYNTRSEHNLYFNPNISKEGVRGMVDIHGLVCVLVCGTLHQQEKCVGIFEQLFGLIRDPSACNNWKIKKTLLHLKSSDMISHLPTLEEGKLLYSIESA